MIEFGRNSITTQRLLALTAGRIGCAAAMDLSKIK